MLPAAAADRHAADVVPFTASYALYKTGLYVHPTTVSTPLVTPYTTQSDTDPMIDPRSAHPATASSRGEASTTPAQLRPRHCQAGAEPL
eukprot:CAMPEP_0173444076 /NCGR_PEP_ID=MMETSP1357-20121228/31455_1 /TAXON_ID=77926 /ORGANISM="Hemiselmis rufescens, Strain PCC563" /LENGTH=88 /DNA_ID=CAMNT_0014410079 /DNA_START=127 /DNA_END=391 /DNA_ORIENTATION=+